MQTLQVKLRNGETRTVHVHRSFQDISGLHIFQHHNGVYGYVDGAPVQSRAELDHIPPPHRRLALSWWERAGARMSADYYGAIEEENRRLAGDFQEELAAAEANTALDSVLYTRQQVAGGKKQAVTAPKPWMEFGFRARPDWWGQAKEIAFSDVIYRTADPEGPPSPPDLIPETA